MGDRLSGQVQEHMSEISARTGVRRIAAFGVDWVVVALWGAVLFLAVMVSTGARGLNMSNPWIAQGIGLLLMTVPVTLYFALSESSRLQATLGKRLFRLNVSGMTGDRLPLSRSLLRNVVKFLPWECGHTVAHQLFHAGDGDVPFWVWGFSALSFGLPLLWIFTVLLRNRTPYDAWSGAFVREIQQPDEPMDPASRCHGPCSMNGRND